jgi:hypothetical protein
VLHGQMAKVELEDVFSETAGMKRAEALDPDSFHELPKLAAKRLSVRCRDSGSDKCGTE